MRNSRIERPKLGRRVDLDVHPRHDRHRPANLTASLVFSRIAKAKIEHALITTVEVYEVITQHMRRHARLQIAK